MSTTPRSRIRRNLIDLVPGTALSRVLGMLRELVIAARFGTGVGADLFVIALTIPTFFRRLLGEDVIERSVMPAFKRLLSTGDDAAAWRLLSACFNLMVLMSIVVMAFLYALTPIILRIVAPGLGPELMPDAIRMVHWILPFVLLVALAAYVGGFLNILECNRIYSLAPATLSIGVIVGVWLWEPHIGMLALPAGFLLGAACHFLVQLPWAWRLFRARGGRFSWSLGRGDSETRKARREGLLIFAKSLLDKSVDVVDRMVASFLASGSIMSLYLAQRLIQFPVALTGLAIGRAVTPYLAEQSAAADRERFARGIQHCLALNMQLLLPCAAFTAVMASDVVALVFERGAFTENSTNLTAIALQAYALGLPAMGAQALFARALSVLQKNSITLQVSAVTSVLNLLLNVTLVWTALRHAGVAMASAIAFTANAIALYVVLNRELSRHLHRGQMYMELGLTGLASLAATLALLAMGSAGGEVLASGDMPVWLGRVLEIGIAGGAFAAVYLLVLLPARRLMRSAPRSAP